MEAPGFRSALAQQCELSCHVPWQQLQTFPRDEALHILPGLPGTHWCSVSRWSRFKPWAHRAQQGSQTWGMWVPRLHASLLRPEPWPYTGREQRDQQLPQLSAASREAGARLESPGGNPSTSVHP